MFAANEGTYNGARQEMPDKPYRDRGVRLRRRREELQKAGRLPLDLTTLAKKARVSVSGFQMWERGETWPRQKKKANLALMLGWTEQELDFGPQEGERPNDMTSFHPVNQQELEMLALFRALEDQRDEAIRYFRAKVAARHTVGPEIRGNLRVVSDEEVAKHIPPAKSGKTTKHR
jgi:transcriptional regulator with XRE-family HTH domain